MSIEEYRVRLLAHDWHHEYSDDARAWRNGRADLMELRRMQAEHDPGFDMWNMYAPAEFHMRRRE